MLYNNENIQLKSLEMQLYNYQWREYIYHI